MINKILLEFFRKGEVAQISLGSKPDFVKDILGNPDEVLISGDYKLYKYGSLEITFLECVTVIICFEIFENMIYLPDVICKDEIAFTSSLEALTSEFSEAEIDWHVSPDNCYDQIVSIVTEGQVLIFYELPDIGGQKIIVSNLTQDFYSYQ